MYKNHYIVCVLIVLITNIAWIFLWHYLIFPLTLVAMLGILVLLILIYLRLDICRTQVSTAEKWLVHIPFSIYLGWITVATIANVTSLLDYLGWSGWGVSPEVWAILMLLAAVVISGIMSITRGDIAYSLVLIWAFVGIAVKHQGTSTVSAAAWIAALLVGLLLIVGVVLNRKPK